MKRILRFATNDDSTVSPYDPSSIIIFNGMDAEPDTDRKVAIDTLVRGLKTDGNWNFIDAFWFPASHTEQAGKINWKNPALHLLNPIGSPDTFFRGANKTIDKFTNEKTTTTTTERTTSEETPKL